MFPIHTKNSIVLPSVNTPDRVESVLSVIEEELRSVQARKIRVDGESIVFRGGFFRPVSGLNPLIGITKGRISVHLEPNVIILEYELWFTELLFVAIALSCCGGVAGLTQLQWAPGAAVCLGLFFFTLFFGLNMLFQSCPARQL
jgi:hypothetical protein